MKIRYLKNVFELPIDKLTTQYACSNSEYDILLTIYITLTTQHTHLYQYYQNNDHFDKLMSHSGKKLTIMSPANL
jgi:hypothetical protein